MEVDKIQRQVSKFQRVSSNGSTTTTDIPSNRGDFNHVDDDAAAAGSRLCGWPSSRIVRVSRASGGKDRHSKVLTSKGLRDRRVRLSVSTAIQFYDLQDRLGFDQPSKAVEWLLKAASSSIDELPSLDPPFPGVFSGEKKNQEIVSQAKSPAYSSTSETSKGSGLSLSRSENRNKARERAREMASKKDKTRVRVLNQVNSMPENSPSFTDLLTGGISTTSRSHMDYFYTAGDSYNYVPAVTTTTGGGETYQLNFAMTSSSTGGGFSRGTLQSNLQSSLLPHHHHQHLQSSSIDGSTSANLPFFAVDHYPATGGYHLNYGGEAGGRRSDHHHKGKSKN